MSGDDVVANGATASTLVAHVSVDMRGEPCLVSGQHPLRDFRQDGVSQSTDRAAEGRITGDVTRIAGAAGDVFEGVGGGRRKSGIVDAELHDARDVCPYEDTGPPIGDAECPTHAAPDIARGVWRLLPGVNRNDAGQDIGNVVRVDDVVPDHLCWMADDDRRLEVGHSPKYSDTTGFKRCCGEPIELGDVMAESDLLSIYRDYLQCLNERRWDDLGRFVA